MEPRTTSCEPRLMGVKGREFPLEPAPFTGLHLIIWRRFIFIHADKFLMPRDGALDCILDFLHFERLAEIRESAQVEELFSIDLILRSKHTGHHNHWSGRMFCLNVFQKLAAAESRHRNVRK